MALTFLQANAQGDWYSNHTKRAICRASDGRIYISYRVQGGGGGLGPYAAWIGYSDDNGLTWAFEVIPGQNAADRNEVISIAIDSNDNLICVWELDVGNVGDFQVVYRKRSAAGVWGAQIVVSDPVGAQFSWQPSVAIDSVDTAHIVWSEQDHPAPAQHDDIHYNTVDAAGVLGAELDISQQALLQRNMNPRICVDKNDVAHILWMGNGKGAFPLRNQIKYNTVTAGVVGVEQLITDNNGLVHWAGQLAADSNADIHAVYEEWAGGVSLGFNYVNNIGGAWNPPVNLLAALQEEGMSVTVDAEDNVYVCHIQNTIPGTLRTWRNGVLVDTVVLQLQFGDLSTMHSWYPRSGGTSPNILSGNWLGWCFWPVDVNNAYIFFPNPLPPPPPPPVPPAPPPTPALGVVTLAATEIR